MAKLYFYYSAMNAGKSTTLLQSAHNYRERGMNVLLFTPLLDNRYQVGKITSRIGLEADATAFEHDHDLFLHVRDEHRREPLHCVLVDEAQFLTAAQVLQLTLVCDRLGIPVLAYGIRTDFQGEPFEGSKYLLAWAEELVEIKTVCPSGKKATMNARLDADGNRVWEGQQVDVGHHYLALSRKEFALEKVSPVGYQPPREDQGKDEWAWSAPASTEDAIAARRRDSHHLGMLDRRGDHHRTRRARRMEFEDLSHRVIGCAIKVQRELGPGLLESTYEQYVTKMKDGIFVH